MTSLVAWIGVDTNGPSSVYLASDSRISWKTSNSVLKWDYGRKLFASKKHPILLGYVGDVLFPSQVLGQIVELLDANLLIDDTDLPDRKWEKLVQVVKRSFEEHPDYNSRHYKVAFPFTLVFCTREGSKTKSCFHLSTLSWNPASGWANIQPLDMPTESGIIKAFGSGVSTVYKWYNEWEKAGRTRGEGAVRASRFVFSSFCDALQSDEDKLTGGPPQLIGIYRQGPAKSFGVIYRNQKYLLGLPVDDNNNLDLFEWRNELFEICDWRTMQRCLTAQPHARPRQVCQPKS